MRDGKLVAVMLVVSQVVLVGGNTLCKAAMARGMSNFVFVFYGHFLALLFLIPSAFIHHRNTPFPPITSNIICRLFLLGLINYCCAIFSYIGISYSSPTLASAMANLSPALTFTLAIIFRMEILKLRSKSTLYKLIGAIISIVGAFIMIFYQGSPIVIYSPPSPSMITFHPILALELTSWIIGGILLVTGSIFLSLLYIIKTWTVRDLPSDVLVTVIFIFFETNIAAMVAFVAEHRPSVWIPSTTLELTTILFGAFEACLINVVHTWACRKKGPVFAVIFKPLQMITAVIMGVTLLGETLRLGSIIGGATIVIGFYSVKKGKAEEEMLEEGGQGDGTASNSFSLTLPLLLANS